MTSSHRMNALQYQPSASLRVTPTVFFLLFVEQHLRRDNLLVYAGAFPSYGVLKTASHLEIFLPDLVCSFFQPDGFRHWRSRARAVHVDETFAVEVKDAAVVCEQVEGVNPVSGYPDVSVVDEGKQAVVVPFGNAEIRRYACFLWFELVEFVNIKHMLFEVFVPETRF